MTRMIRGSVLLAACVGLWSCSSDPLGNEAGVPFKIVSLPSIVFVNEGSSQLIGFQLVDELDGQIPATWTIGATPPEFSVAIDSSFRPVYNSDGTLTLPPEQTEIRATITGLLAGATEFTVSAGGKSLTIPVYVVPVAFQATVTPTAVAIFDTVTVTMPAGYILRPDAVFDVGLDTPAYPYSIAADGSSATMVVPPGTDAAMTIAGVEIDFLPGTSLTLPTLTPISRPAQDNQSAPVVITLPTAGNTLTFIDGVGDGTDQYYGFTSNGVDNIRLTVTWAGGADIDLLWQNSAGSYVGNFNGATGANPETTTVLLAAGNYTFDLNIYDDHGEPPQAYTITIENLGP